ncbi:MAG: ATP-binding protein [Bdellovibrionales bacterium]
MKIVLTGGPSAGKTTVAEALVRTYPDKLALVPEGASILFRGGFPREDAPDSVVCQQRAIYYVQRELEELRRVQFPRHSLICDRGTLDGLAYWPKGEDEFFKQIRSLMTDEIVRYDWVLHLDTASQEFYESSSVRTESFIQAQSINERVKHASREHPKRLLIKNNRNFSLKIRLALEAVGMILAGEPISKIEDLFRK